MPTAALDKCRKDPMEASAGSLLGVVHVRIKPNVTCALKLNSRCKLITKTFIRQFAVPSDYRHSVIQAA